ncbi:hypothetical protein FACS189419_07240 [Planctomycetales bacterium]|nr:hypothetical protein FACS189419_07240 [Planctomycetales bacterium]
MPPDNKDLRQRSPADLGRVFPSGVRVGKTSYGFGVFAFAFIPQSTPIARVSGHIICDPDYSSDYCIDAGSDKVLEPAPPFCYLNHSCEPNCQLMQYVRQEESEEDETLETGILSEDEMNLDNDSSFEAEDECYYGGAETEEYGENETEDSEEDEEQIFEDDSAAEIWIESISDILPGEELTIDYAWPADRAAKCLCGKPTCRGWIVTPDELELLS